MHPARISSIYSIIYSIYKAHLYAHTHVHDFPFICYKLHVRACVGHIGVRMSYTHAASVAGSSGATVEQLSRMRSCLHVPRVSAVLCVCVCVCEDCPHVSGIRVCKNVYVSVCMRSPSCGSCFYKF